jgi:hypothetical protein
MTTGVISQPLFDSTQYFALTAVNILIFCQNRIYLNAFLEGLVGFSKGNSRWTVQKVYLQKKGITRSQPQGPFLGDRAVISG